MKDILNFYQNDHGGTTEEMIADLVKHYENKDEHKAKCLVTSSIEALGTPHTIGCRFKIEDLEVEHYKGQTVACPYDIVKECDMEAIDWLARITVEDLRNCFYGECNHD